MHDRGRVLADLACSIADGARVISDFRLMGDQRELFGLVASVPTAWRTLREIADEGKRAETRIAAAVSTARQHAWAQVISRHGTLPGGAAGGQDAGWGDLHPAGALLAGGTVVIQSEVTRLDPADVLSTVARERVQALLMVGDAFARPLCAEAERGSYDLSSLATIATSDATLSPAMKERLLGLSRRRSSSTSAARQRPAARCLR